MDGVFLSPMGDPMAAATSSSRKTASVAAVAVSDIDSDVVPDSGGGLPAELVEAPRSCSSAFMSRAITDIQPQMDINIEGDY